MSRKGSSRYEYEEQVLKGVRAAFEKALRDAIVDERMHARRNAKTGFTSYELFEKQCKASWRAVLWQFQDHKGKKK